MRENYVQGSTARTLENRQRREFYTEVPIKRNTVKTVQWTPVYVIMLIGVVIFLLVTCMKNVFLYSEIARLRSEKGALTDSYEDLVLSNNLYYDRIMSEVDLKEIEHIAVAELGMQRAGSGQIVNSSGDIEDYVKQYSDLPEP